MTERSLRLMLPSETAGPDYSNQTRGELVTQHQKAAKRIDPEGWKRNLGSMIVSAKRTKLSRAFYMRTLRGPRWPFELPKMARDPQRVTECLRDPLRAAVLGKGAWPIFLHGEAGSGKTLAALCVGDWCGDCAYVDMPTLCHMVNDAAFGRLLDDDGSAIQVTAVWKNWANANLAIIDEIGSRGKVSDAHFETLKMTLDSRERLNKPLIAISNLDPEALANVYDDRIASRLSAGTVCRVDGDRRLEIHDAQAVDSPSPAAAKRRVG